MLLLHAALDLVPLGVLLDDLGVFLATPNGLEWTDVALNIRDVNPVYGDRIIGLPVLQYDMLMYYRRDVFAQYNLSVPQTWEQLVGLARDMNGGCDEHVCSMHSLATTAGTCSHVCLYVSTDMELMVGRGHWSCHSLELFC